MELTEGIIVKTIKYKEHDKIAYILTKDNYLSLLIRSSLEYKSKNFSYSNELTKINFNVILSKKNSFDIISSGVVKQSYAKIKSNLKVLELAYNILVIVSRVSDHVTNYEGFYNLLDYTLNNLEDNCLDYNICLYYSFIFKLKLLYLLGIGPHFRDCVVCGNKEINGFSIENGGVICNKCMMEINTKDYILQNEITEIIKVLYLGKFELLNTKLIKEIDNMKINNINIIEEINKFINLYYDKYLSI